MTEINDGGPARDKSLRQEAALTILAAMVASESHGDGMCVSQGSIKGRTFEQANAQRALEMTDALIAELATPPPAAKSGGEHPTPWRREESSGRTYIMDADDKPIGKISVGEGHSRARNESAADLIIAHANRTPPKCGCGELVAAGEVVYDWFLEESARHGPLVSGFAFTNLHTALRKHAGESK